MDEETTASPVVPVTKAIDESEINADLVKALNGDVPPAAKEGKKEEEETALDGEFIKVEKESFEGKDGHHMVESASSQHNTSSLERSSSNSVRELLETQEKMKELEIELERVVGALKHTESENIQLKDEVSETKEKLEISGKKYEELEHNHRKLQQHIIEAEEKYGLELSTLQQALQAQEAKYKELINVKEDFDGLQLEHGHSRKRLLELEHELQCSAGEARKFEELHKESGSHAESQTKRALEFEQLLEVAKLSAKEKEDQMTSLQEEMKGLYDKIAENQKVEEALEKTTAELSAVQQELTLSKSQTLELEQRLSSKEGAITELMQELELIKASESQVKGDLTTLEDTFESVKDDLQAKVKELEQIKLKLEEEMSMRGTFEGQFKAQEVQFLDVQEKLAKVATEKEAIEATVGDLNANVALMKDLCAELESKLKLSEDNNSKADSLLSQALSDNGELEQKLKSLEELHNASGEAAAAATQRNVELESIVQASTAAAEEAKAQMKELEARFIAAEQKSKELEEQLNLAVQKSSDAERELEDFAAKVSELTTTLRELEGGKEQQSTLIQEYQDKINQLEASLSHSSTRHSELEEELKSTVGKCAEHEDRAKMTHQRSLELEDLIQISHSKAEDSGKRVSELELLLETEKYRIQELEDQINSLEKKCAEAEADSKKFSDGASELASEVEAFQARSSSLEIALQTAQEKEKELTECLNVATEEKKRLEDASSSSATKLAETESLLELLRDELGLTQQKLESIESDLKASGIRESEVLEKLRLAEEQMEQQVKLLEQTTSKRSELESLHQSVTRDFELKLEEAMTSFSSRDSEAKSLFEKLKILEDQAKGYEGQVAEASGKSASLKEELDQSVMKVALLEGTVEELRKQIVEAETLREELDQSVMKVALLEGTVEELRKQIVEVENKASQSLSDNELLVETNVQLKNRVNELQESLNTAISEREATAQQLVSHVSDVNNLKDQHSRAIELHTASEARILEAEKQLQEAELRFSQKDTEAKELNEKLIVLEGQIEAFKEEAHEVSTTTEKQKVELEETLLKLKHLEDVVEELQAKSSQAQKENEGLAEANLKLAEELAAYEGKLNDLQVKFSAAVAEKDEVTEQLRSLELQLTTEGQTLKSQINSLMEEKNLLGETYGNSKKELESLMFQLEERAKEKQTSEDTLQCEIENLKAEILEKSALQTRLKELEEVIAKKSITEEQRARAEAETLVEREASLKESLEKLEEKSKAVVTLEQQVTELEHKLQQAEAKLLKKDTAASEVQPQKATEIKSRDIGSPVSTPSKRKSKKKVEPSPPLASTSSPTQAQAHDTSPFMTFKLILGVALFSVVLGIILGKRY
ncbi:hypothetical protein EUGRSUZ_A00904 [Eucalyptus grandis]|uniref:WIT1/2 N-terminal helical bundle domain-containing protein n=2 Tax=Eucalyptus grandis TaxID=71139 RepID=A0A059DDJ2_EUCGR|nr:hypothetical protein EUGRSUZ_A00904 [Eucalyptus grandis]